MLNSFVTSSLVEHRVRFGDGIGPNTAKSGRLAAHKRELTFRQAHGVLLGSFSKGMLAAHQLIPQRATVLGFEQAFVVAGFILLAGMPLALLLRPSRAC